MAELVDALAKHLGDGWLLAAVVGILFIANSGVIPWLFGERRRVVDDHRQLVAVYEAEAENVRRWRAQDAEQYERKIARLEQLIDKMTEAALLSERGNARLRHLVGNLFQHIAAQRAAERRRGETPLPYDGWREAMNISPDLDETLKGLFDESGRSRPTEVC